MPPITAVEAAAKAVVDAAKGIHPERLWPFVTETFGARGVSQAGDGALESGAAGVKAGPKDELLNANKALVRHVGDLVPQTVDGQLDWILSGSSASNLLADARKIDILDPTKLPQIVPIRTVEISDGARTAYLQMARRVGDVDAFAVNGGRNEFATSPFVRNMSVTVPDSAIPALKAVGEYRSEPLIQATHAVFEKPEIAAIDLGDRTVYTMGPGQQMGNKFRHVLRYYSPAEQQKMTGDFSHLLDAASNIYSDSEVLQFGRQAIAHNNLLYDGQVMAPWGRSADVEKFVGYMRKVLESEGRNGQYLRGLNIDSGSSLDAMRLFEKLPAAADKQAVADFINSQGAF